MGKGHLEQTGHVIPEGAGRVQRGWCGFPEFFYRGGGQNSRDGWDLFFLLPLKQVGPKKWRLTSHRTRKGSAVRGASQGCGVWEAQRLDAEPGLAQSVAGRAYGTVRHTPPRRAARHSTGLGSSRCWSGRPYNQIIKYQTLLLLAQRCGQFC